MNYWVGCFSMFPEGSDLPCVVGRALGLSYRSSRLQLRISCVIWNEFLTLSVIRFPQLENRAGNNTFPGPWQELNELPYEKHLQQSPAQVSPSCNRYLEK